MDISKNNRECTVEPLKIKNEDLQFIKHIQKLRTPLEIWLAQGNHIKSDYERRLELFNKILALIDHNPSDENLRLFFHSLFKSHQLIIVGLRYIDHKGPFLLLRASGHIDQEINNSLLIDIISRNNLDLLDVPLSIVKNGLPERVEVGTLLAVNLGYFPQLIADDMILMSESKDEVISEIVEQSLRDSSGLPKREFDVIILDPLNGIEYKDNYKFDRAPLKDFTGANHFISKLLYLLKIKVTSNSIDWSGPAYIKVNQEINQGDSIEEAAQKVALNRMQKNTTSFFDKILGKSNKNYILTDDEIYASELVDYEKYYEVFIKCTKNEFSKWYIYAQENYRNIYEDLLPLIKLMELTSHKYDKNERSEMQKYIITLMHEEKNNLALNEESSDDTHDNGSSSS